MIVWKKINRITLDSLALLEKYYDKFIISINLWPNFARFNFFFFSLKFCYTITRLVIEQ